MDEHRGWPDHSEPRGLERRLRLAFLQGAEHRSMIALGRGLTADELRRVIARYPAADARRSR